MHNEINDYIKQFCEDGLNRFSEHIKLLLYKNDKSIFERIDFENDSIFIEPLLFAYFNDKKPKTDLLEAILLGYQDEVSCGDIKIQTDNNGRFYMPNIGWFTTDLNNKKLSLNRGDLSLRQDDDKVDHHFEKLEILEGTGIELLKFPIPLLDKCYYNADGSLVDVEIEEITKIHRKNLAKAYNLIKTNIPEHYQLILKCAPKCVIFNVDSYQRNSFAYIGAHGIAFYNAYQKDYNEVFFVDDIAHQTGHIILTNIISKPEDFFKIDKSTILEVIKTPDGKIIERRNLEVLFHALYTYYTTFICLDACLEDNSFEGKQRHEALGRIYFYIGKCYRDLLLIDNPIKSNENSKKYFSKKGLTIYEMIKSKWYEIYNKWISSVQHFNMKNQPYNFTYSVFLESNPIDENIY